MCAAAQHVAAPRSVPRLAAQPRKSAEIALNYLDAVARLRNRLHAEAVGDQQRKGTRTLKRPQRANIALRCHKRIRLGKCERLVFDCAGGAMATTPPGPACCCVEERYVRAVNELVAHGSSKCIIRHSLINRI